ncbi:MAG: methylthioribose-1-phosphate isomerase [Candidatus Binatia bacterium]|nr:MAG: methylthioribose-1-phosphate isomerase [Candidatus Binatia bacterium]
MIDQRLLPRREVYRVLRTYEQVARAIETMVVRGAPAIGVSAAFGIALGARKAADPTSRSTFERMCRRLAATRPTAVNLFWAIARMRRAFESSRARGPEAVREALLREALAIQEEDIAANLAIGRHGAPLLPRTGLVLTHCNAGALATAGYGTALGVIRTAYERHPTFEVVVTETRPFLQGARLTAWELRKDRIPTTLVVDSAAGLLMRQGRIRCVIVGTDRTAANGDVANKIGTYTLAVLAREHGIPFYVAAPLSSVDFECETGRDIPIEERDPQEVTRFADRPVAPDGIRVENPAFDVTPHELVTAIVTERGVARPPFRTSLRRLLRAERERPRLRARAGAR